MVSNEFWLKLPLQTVFNFPLSVKGSGSTIGMTCQRTTARLIKMTKNFESGNYFRFHAADRMSVFNYI
ncbi:MAG: hypothetical protein C0490_02635 [Marivirga sp.]|nr:hypothetical protein [Marivirga sp.]